VHVCVSAHSCLGLRAYFSFSNSFHCRSLLIEFFDGQAKEEKRVQTERRKLLERDENERDGLLDRKREGIARRYEDGRKAKGSLLRSVCSHASQP